MELEYYLEKEASDAGFSVVCGVDEAGRGPLAGPVYAAAVILDSDNVSAEYLQALDDSKKLTEKKRDALEVQIKEHALSWCVAYSTVQEIEESDILSERSRAFLRTSSRLL